LLWDQHHQKLMRRYLPRKENARTRRYHFLAQFELTTIVNDHGDRRPIFLISGDLSDLGHYIVESADHSAKYDVFT